MSIESPNQSGSTHFNPPVHQIKARQMGELVRGDSRWDVVLESVLDPGVNGVRGRIHFVSGTVHRLTTWIFLEWSDGDVENRFSELASDSQMLWNLLGSLEER